MIKLEDLSREGLCAVSFDILININQSIFTAHMAKENSVRKTCRITVLSCNTLINVFV